MKKALFAMMLFAVLGGMNSAVFAAELLDVKPVVAESAVSIEISADTAMTYTYYTIPGQARAVVDIAEADPEKIEPLIVVNKGTVNSISVDKAQISGIIVSRIIFNLVSESDISVSATPDRKLLTVTFGGSPAATGTSEPKPEPKPVQLPVPVEKNELPVAGTATPPLLANPEAAPPVPDGPAAKSVVPLAESPAAESGAPLLPAAAVIRSPKLVPVVPVLPVAPARPTALTVKGITSGASYIEIRTNQPVPDYKASRITGPDRLVIDIAGEKINQKPKSIAIKKFGIIKARIGVSPHNIRIVIDSGTARFPEHTITTIDEGLRINFKKIQP